MILHFCHKGLDFTPDQNKHQPQNDKKTSISVPYSHITVGESKSHLGFFGEGVLIKELIPSVIHKSLLTFTTESCPKVQTVSEAMAKDPQIYTVRYYYFFFSEQIILYVGKSIPLKQIIFSLCRQIIQLKPDYYKFLTDQSVSLNPNFKKNKIAKLTRKDHESSKL